MQEKTVSGWTLFRYLWLSSTTCFFSPDGTRQNVVEGHSLWRSLEWVLAEYGQKGGHQMSNDGHLFWNCTFPPFMELPSPTVYWGHLEPLRPVILLVTTLKRQSDPTPFLPIPLGILPGIRTKPKIWWMMFLSTLIWTDGSREPIPHLDVDVAGAGALVHAQPLFLIVISGDMLRILMAGWRAALTSSQGSSVQCSRPKELSIGVEGGGRGVILALQAYSKIHVASAI